MTRKASATAVRLRQALQWNGFDVGTLADGGFQVTITETDAEMLNLPGHVETVDVAGDVSYTSEEGRYVRLSLADWPVPAARAVRVLELLGLLPDRCIRKAMAKGAGGGG